MTVTERHAGKPTRAPRVVVIATRRRARCEVLWYVRKKQAHERPSPENAHTRATVRP
jgi:hypothetical protein